MISRLSQVFYFVCGRSSTSIKVYCLPEEKEQIEAQAKRAGMSAARIITRSRSRLSHLWCGGLWAGPEAGSDQWRPWPFG